MVKILPIRELINNVYGNINWFLNLYIQIWRKKKKRNDSNVKRMIITDYFYQNMETFFRTFFNNT